MNTVNVYTQKLHDGTFRLDAFYIKGDLRGAAKQSGLPIAANGKSAANHFKQLKAFCQANNLVAIGKGASGYLIYAKPTNGGGTGTPVSTVSRATTESNAATASPVPNEGIAPNTAAPNTPTTPDTIQAAITTLTDQRGRINAKLRDLRRQLKAALADHAQAQAQAQAEAQTAQPPFPSETPAPTASHWQPDECPM